MTIEVCQVSHRFGDLLVLDRVSAHLDGPRTAVIGANGSGKSTFARLLNGLIVPDEGAVTVGGLDTARDGKQVRRRVGFVFQDPDLQIVMPTVEEDLAFGLKPLRLQATEIASRVDSALAEAGLTQWRHHPAHLLSGGQKQMLAIAAVLITMPDWVILDEPTTLLDRRNTMAVAERLAGLSQRVVLVTHDLDLAATFPRTLVFERGRVVFDGPSAVAIDRYVTLTEKGCT